MGPPNWDGALDPTLGKSFSESYSLSFCFSQRRREATNTELTVTCHEAVSGVNLRLVVTRAVRTLGAAPAHLEMLKTLPRTATIALC